MSVKYIQNGKEKGYIRNSGFSSYNVIPKGYISTLSNMVDTKVIEAVKDSRQELINTINTTRQSAQDAIEVSKTLSSQVDKQGNKVVSIEENYGTRLDGVETSAYYGILLDNGGHATGFETGSILNRTTGEFNDFFGIRADKFYVTKSSVTVTNEMSNDQIVATLEANDIAVTDDSIAEAVGQTYNTFSSLEDPALAINWDGSQYNTYFNGRVHFQNLANGNGETIISGGLITTQDVRIANSLVVGSTLAPVNYGNFPIIIDDTQYKIPNEDYINVAILKEILPIGTHLQFGDKYSDSTNEYEYVFESGGSWKSVQDVASKDATDKVNAAKQDAKDKADKAEQNAKDALAQNIGYTDYDNMVSVAESTGKIVASGGYLNANVIDANFITADMILGSTITAEKVNFIGTSTDYNSIYVNNDGKLVLGDIQAKSIEAGSSVITDGSGGNLSSHIFSVIEKDSSDTSDGYSAFCAKAGDSEGAAIYVSQGYTMLQQIIAPEICGGLVDSTGATATLSTLILKGYSNSDRPAITIDNEGTGYQVQGENWFVGSNGDIWADSFHSFTGVHDALLVSEADIGDILADTGKIYKESISQGYGEAKVVSNSKNPAVIGVYKGITSGIKYKDSIMSLGEGYMNVCDQAGNITIGDYICSSDVQGKGMKQDDDLMHNYTVAKARESIIWDDLEEYEELDGHKWTQIACTYHCG